MQNNKQLKWALVAFGISLGLANSSALALDEPFPGALFNDPNKSSGQPSASQSAAKQSYQDRVRQANDSMRHQIQKVASWLQEFSLRNQNRFPGTYGSSGTIERACEVQLTELAGPNPFSGSWPAVAAQELNGLSPGLASSFSDGSPVEGSPIDNDEWTAELSADQAGRIKLQMDDSAAASTINSYRTNPPLNWQAAPGTIVGSGNGQGYLYVWGAGIDGKPIKDASGNVYIVEANTGNIQGNSTPEAGN